MENKEIIGMSHDELRDAIEHYRANWHDAYNSVYFELRAKPEYRVNGRFRPTMNKDHAQVFLKALRENVEKIEEYKKKKVEA
jgi:hypothetical protein